MSKEIITEYFYGKFSEKSPELYYFMRYLGSIYFVLIWLAIMNSRKILLVQLHQDNS